MYRDTLHWTVKNKYNWCWEIQKSPGFAEKNNKSLFSFMKHHLEIYTMDSF